MQTGHGIPPLIHSRQTSILPLCPTGWQNLYLLASLLTKGADGRKHAGPEVGIVTDVVTAVVSTDRRTFGSRGVRVVEHPGRHSGKLYAELIRYRNRIDYNKKTQEKKAKKPPQWRWFFLVVMVVVYFISSSLRISDSR